MYDCGQYRSENKTKCRLKCLVCSQKAASMRVEICRNIFRLNLTRRTCFRIRFLSTRLKQIKDTLKKDREKFTKKINKLNEIEKKFDEFNLTKCGILNRC